MRTVRPVELALLLLAASLLAACGGEGKPEGTTTATGALAAFDGLEGSIDIAGGTAHIPVMQEAAKNVMKAWPRVRITVAGGGSGVGVQKVGEGLVDIGNAGRAVKPAENEKYGLTSFSFAVDGVAVVVHPANPLRELTSEQAREVFAGTITNWKALGGADREIHLYGRDEASGTREVFWKKLLAKGEVAASTNVVPSNGAMKTAVSGDEDAIGYLSIGHVDDAVAAIAIDGVEANQANAKSGAYPVVRKLYMNTKGKPTGLVRAFIDYVMSADCAEIVTGAGYIPLAGE